MLLGVMCHLTRRWRNTACIRLLWITVHQRFSWGWPGTPLLSTFGAWVASSSKWGLALSCSTTFQIRLKLGRLEGVRDQTLFQSQDLLFWPHFFCEFHYSVQETMLQRPVLFWFDVESLIVNWLDLLLGFWVLIKTDLFDTLIFLGF